MAGTSYNVIILSSSPPAPELIGFISPHDGSPAAATRRVSMSASPPRARSPPVNLQRKGSGASETYAREAAGPLEAARAFATVSSLVQSEYFASALHGNEHSVPSTRPLRATSNTKARSADAAKKPRKRAVKTATADDDPTNCKPKPRGRKPKTDKESITVDKELHPPPVTQSPFFLEDAPFPAPEAAIEHTTAPRKLAKSGKPRKPRAKKPQPDNGSLELKIKKVRSTKSASVVKDGLRKAQDVNVSAGYEDGDVREYKRSPPTGDADTSTLRTGDSYGSNADDTTVREQLNTARRKKRAPRKKRDDLLDEGLHLDEAVSRRRNWTPPRETVVVKSLTDSAEKENRRTNLDTGSNAFTAIVNGFGYAQSPTRLVCNAAAAPAVDTMGLTKRRRVELVDVPANQINSRDSSPEKGKVRKKKPRTITDLVTGQYAPKDPSPHQDSATSDFFQPRTVTTRIPLNNALDPQAYDPSKKSVRKRSTSRSESEKADPKPKTRTPKMTAKAATKSKPVAEKLLSPSSALARVNQQIVLFGTASQLALGESPRTVRQIQSAIKESERETAVSATEIVSPLVCRRRLSAIKGKRSLWNVSTRDHDGGLLENGKNPYLPAPNRRQDINLLVDGTADESSEPSTFVDIDDIAPPPTILISSNPPTPPQRTQPTPQPAASQIVHRLEHKHSFDDIDDFFQELPPSNQNQESHDSFADIDDLQTLLSTQSRINAPPKPRPPASVCVTKASVQHYSGSTKSVAAKPAAKPTSTAPSIKSKSYLRPSSAPSTPPKPPPRFVDIEEILDSEDEVLEALSPTPPRIRRLEDLPPLPLISMGTGKSASRTVSPVKDSHLVPVFCVPAANLMWAGMKPIIFSSVSAHIHAMLPTTDPTRPSWHERILMYDPIPLEDFTAYLNDNTSIRAYKRATQKQIKAWNKYLKGLGQEVIAVGKDDGNVLAVEKEIEAFMVQEWCQNYSICCIWTAGRSKGGPRKGYF